MLSILFDFYKTLTTIVNYKILLKPYEKFSLELYLFSISTKYDTLKWLNLNLHLKINKFDIIVKLNNE